MNQPAPITIIIPVSVALLIIDDIMANFPEASQTLQVTSWRYKERIFLVEDTEAGDQHQVDEAALLKGFVLMFVPGKWPKGLTFPPASGEYAGTSDMESPWAQWLLQADCHTHDAFLQLAVFGEVRYG